MEKPKLRIALFQSNIKWEDKQHNFESLEKSLQDLEDHEIDCVFLPEMSFTGFSMNVEEIAEDDNLTMNAMSEYARKYGVTIGFGWVGRTSEQKYENHYSIVDKSGLVISDYVKCHPFFCEKGLFAPGDRMTFCQVNGIGISNVICYDLRFPEVFRAMDSRAHIILVPADWPARRREHWKALLKSRAIENQVYVVGINGVGNIGGVDYAGDSCVINPDGNEIYVAPSEAGLFLFDIQDDVEYFREKFPVLEDRRNGFYTGLYKKME